MAQFTSDNQPKGGERKSLTLEQEIAQLEAKLERKKNAQKKLRDGQMIVLGSTAFVAARNESEARKSLLAWCDKYITRDVDKTRVEPVIAELKAMQTATATPEKTAAVAAGKP